MNKLVLLVVDDEPGIRSGVTRSLRNFSVNYPFMEEDISYEILEAESGEEALEIIENSQVDIVLLDNKLPGIEGIEVLEHIKSKNLDMAVTMITSYASLDLAIKATNHGAFSFVPKPFTPQELKTAIESITKHLYLRRMTKQLKEEGKEVRFQFLSVLSHELKSPINAVEGYLKIMKDKQVGDNIDAYKEMIDRSIERLRGMRGLILDLLDLSRAESGTKSRDIRQLDLFEIIRGVVEAIEPLAIQKNNKVEIKGDEEIMINADKNEVEIIFNNLVSNAVKYNKENGKVFINVDRKSDSVVVTVEDTGIGMTNEEMALLFKDFQRIKNEKTKYITGSGLGLSIAKKMVEMYNGTIEVSSTPDVGSTFKVTLPLS